MGKNSWALSTIKSDLFYKGTSYIKGVTTSCTHSTINLHNVPVDPRLIGPFEDAAPSMPN